MPVQSDEGDPISTALQISLSGNSKEKDQDLSLLLSYSAKQILLSDIKVEEYTYDSTAFLKGLKSKYIVLSEKQAKESPSKCSNDKPKISVSNSSERAVAKTASVNCNERTEPEPKLSTPSRTLWPPDAVNIEWKANTPVGGGFVNLWNSCYLNSTLQALFHLPSFVNWLLTENSHKCLNKSSAADCLICSMAQTLRNSQESTGKAIKPCLVYSRLKSICKHFTPGTQEDAHEFLRHLVDSLDRTYLTPFKDLRLDPLSKETTPLGQIFGGYLRNEVVCQSCRHVSTTFQYFQDLPLDIANSSHIDGALDLFFSKESILEHEGYRCEKCKKKVAFTKKFSLEKAPRVLCIQLKRFGAVSGKNNKTLSIPSKLNLNRFKPNKDGESFSTTSYTIAAVVNHIGTSTSCGHYTAIAMAADKKFYLFDDQRVERLHDISCNSSQAYILLYHQKVPVDISGVNDLHKNVKSIIQVTAQQESAKERIFGKGDSNSNTKISTKLLSSNVLTKVAGTVSSSLSNVFSKVSVGSKASCSNADTTESATSSNHVSASKKSDAVPVSSQTESSETCNKSDSLKVETVKKTEDEKTDKVMDREVTKEKTNSVLNNSNRSHEELNSSQTSSTNCSQPCVDSTNPSPQTTEKVSGHSPNSKKRSLVPYNESSCSSDDEPPSRAAETAGLSPPKKPKINSYHRDLPESNRSNGVSTLKNGVSSPSSRLNGHSSPGKQKYLNGKSNGIGQRLGKCSNQWMVTPNQSNNRPMKKTDATMNNRWEINKWDDDGRNGHKSHLMSMSHQGYGKEVYSWSGDTSEMNKEVNRENYSNQRMSNFNNSSDKPKKKFRKGHHKYSDEPEGFKDFFKKKKKWLYFNGKSYRAGDERRNELCRYQVLHNNRFY